MSDCVSLTGRVQSYRTGEGNGEAKVKDWPGIRQEWRVRNLSIVQRSSSTEKVGECSCVQLCTRTCSQAADGRWKCKCPLWVVWCVEASVKGNAQELHFHCFDYIEIFFELREATDCSSFVVFVLEQISVFVFFSFYGYNIRALQNRCCLRTHANKIPTSLNCCWYDWYFCGFVFM